MQVFTPAKTEGPVDIWVPVRMGPSDRSYTAIPSQRQNHLSEVQDIGGDFRQFIPPITGTNYSQQEIIDIVGDTSGRWSVSLGNPVSIYNIIDPGIYRVIDPPWERGETSNIRFWT